MISFTAVIEITNNNSALGNVGLQLASIRRFLRLRASADTGEESSGPINAISETVEDDGDDELQLWSPFEPTTIAQLGEEYSTDIAEKVNCRFLFRAMITL